jgi:hypothetical protein
VIQIKKEMQTVSLASASDARGKTTVADRSEKYILKALRQRNLHQPHKLISEGRLSGTKTMQSGRQRSTIGWREKEKVSLLSAGIKINDS